MILIKKDSKDAVRYLKIENNIEPEGSYLITRFSGIVGGKEVKQPPLRIKVGKSTRTISEQAELEFNALVRKSMDKGYKILTDFTDKPFEEITQEDLIDYLGEATDSNNIRKPMLAKETGKVKPAFWNRNWLISKKLDGVRCLLYWDEETETVKTASRGGKNYDAATTHIRKIPKLINFLQSRPNIMLDGEIYIHGFPLSEISGLVRLKEYDPEKHDILEFHCYDLAVDNLIFDKRLELLEKLQIYFIDEKKIKILEHIEINGYSEAKSYHDIWVGQGYEGAILRDPLKEYKFGGRDIRMVKLKEFKEEEFEIIGYELGLRGSEDMCFIVKVSDTVTCKAKPLGNRELKERYVKEFDGKIRGKMGTVKFFYYTEDGSLFLPAFKCVRDYE